MKKKSLNNDEYRTDKAKDKGYMDNREKADMVAETARAKGIELGGTEFFDHDSRHDTLGKNLKNYTPFLFALNTSTEKRMDNPRRYYAKKGVDGDLFAQTVEPDSGRFLSADNDTTNHAVAL